MEYLDETVGSKPRIESVTRAGGRHSNTERPPGAGAGEADSTSWARDRSVSRRPQVYYTYST